MMTLSRRPRRRKTLDAAILRLATAPFAGPPMRDGRVLVAAPSGFDPARRFRLFLFLHGDQSDIAGNVVGETRGEDYRLLGQVARAGGPVLLAAPQRFALKLADGRHDRAGVLRSGAGWRAFLAELSRALARTFGGRSATYARAPIWLGAYSGGHAALAAALGADALGRRLERLLLIDAVFAVPGERAATAEILAAYLARHPGVAAEILQGEGIKSRAGRQALEAALARAGVPPARALVRRSAAPHWRMTWDGPPPAPIAEFLRRGRARRRRDRAGK